MAFRLALTRFSSSCSFQYKKQHTLLHKLNGVVMLLSFFGCRVLLFPYLYLAYSRWVSQLPPADGRRFCLPSCICRLCRRYASIPVYAVPLVAPWQCNLGAALLWPLQLYWFALICRRALRPSVPARPSSASPRDGPLK